jgi:hypothetical protein
MNRLFGTLYTVESFEPHADYMVDNDVWPEDGWKARLIRHFERKVKATAFRLYPVSVNYRNRLIQEGAPEERIEVLPCTVDENQFRFDPEARNKLRKLLGIPQPSPVGIYVGKFGGMYLESNEALDALSKVFKNLKNAHLILLSDPESETCKMLRESLPEVEIHTFRVNPGEVPQYLSTSDFALILTRPTKSSCYLSPIKTGEYLTNGLPVVSTPDIGDESALMHLQDFGITTSSLGENPSNFSHWLKNRSTRRNAIAKQGVTLRGRAISHNIYNRLIYDTDKALKENNSN